MGAVADEEIARHLDAQALERIDLFQQGLRIQHQAVSDDPLLAGANDPAWNQCEDKALFADIDSVAGVVAALGTCDDVEAIGDEVDDLAFSLVSPLRTQNDNIGHENLFRCRGATHTYGPSCPVNESCLEKRERRTRGGVLVTYRF